MGRKVRPSVVAVLCTRSTSERFPGKVLASVDGRTLTEHVVERVLMAECVDRVVVAVPDGPHEGRLAALTARLCERDHRVTMSRGDELNVLKRMWGAVHRHGGGLPYVFRVMADQPFLDWVSLDYSTAVMQSRGWDFVLPLSFTEDPVYGGGLFPWSYRTWGAINAHSTGEEREHPGMWLRRNLDQWKYGLVDLPHWMYRPYRLELDQEDDLELVRMVHDAWHDEGPPPLRWVVWWLDRNPHVLELNNHIKERTGTYTSYTQAEVERWQRDYTGREIVWTDITSLVGEIREAKETKYNCDKCGGNLITLSVTRRSGNLKTKCVRCGTTQVFHATKPKGRRP